MCRYRRELSNAYFLAKFCVDTAESEPCQVCPTEQPRSILCTSVWHAASTPRPAPGAGDTEPWVSASRTCGPAGPARDFANGTTSRTGRLRLGVRRNGGCWERRSFSAVSKPNFTSKYALELAICSKRRLRKGTWGETEK